MKKLRAQGWVCSDVAGYVTHVDGMDVERFAAAWVIKRLDAPDDVRIYVGLSDTTKPLPEFQMAEHEEFQMVHRAQQFRGADGKAKFCEARLRGSAKSIGIRNLVPSQLDKLNHPDLAHWDVALSHAANELSDDERQKNALATAEAMLKVLQKDSDDLDSSLPIGLKTGRFSGFLINRELDAMYQRGRARFYLRDDEAALVDLNLYFEKTKELDSQAANPPEKPPPADLYFEMPRNRAQAYELRAMILARLGKRDAALADAAVHRALFKDRNDSPTESKEVPRFRQFVVDANRQSQAEATAYLDAVVAAFLSDEDEAMQEAEARIAAKELGPYKAACAYSLAAGFYGQKNAVKAKRYSDRAVQLLSQAVDDRNVPRSPLGWSELLAQPLLPAADDGDPAFDGLLIDPDLSAIREHPGYRALMVRNRRDIRYTIVRNYVAIESEERHGNDPATHLAQAKELIAGGYRPVGWASLVPGEGRATITASVWWRPIIAEDQKERLAKRQANAAVALLRMTERAPEKQERVWTLLKHSPDPRLRSWLIHRFAPEAADETALAERLKSETDVTIRRALILSLGEYGKMGTPARPAVPGGNGTEHKGKTGKSAHPPEVADLLLDWYHRDPDPGIHGAAEWVLRQWGLKNELAKIDQDLATGSPQSGRQWFVTKTQNHAMVVIPGPIDFQMGAPVTEAGSQGNELSHRQPIKQSFCIATKEVSMQQLNSFLKKVPGIQRVIWEQHSPELDCPWTSVDWYDAARYCRWLSEQEGIPEDQMRYPPIDQINESMRWSVMSDYDNSQRTGYRLPTEAEWEFACRAGADTSRYFGSAEELLGNYAWSIHHSTDRSWPSAQLKPNDFGLFDMLGNALEWNAEQDFEYPRSVFAQSVPPDYRELDQKVLRGGAFDLLSPNVRSAVRFPYQPSIRSKSFGFRVARTMKSAANAPNGE